MARLTHITVTAPRGRLTPVDEKDGIETTGGQMQVDSDHVRRVRFSHTTIRSLGRGDLILCNMDGEPVESFDMANCPNELPDGRISLVELRHKRLDAAVARFIKAVARPAPAKPSPAAPSAPASKKGE